MAVFPLMKRDPTTPTPPPLAPSSNSIKSFFQNISTITTDKDSFFWTNKCHQGALTFLFNLRVFFLRYIQFLLQTFNLVHKIINFSS